MGIPLSTRVKKGILGAVSLATKRHAVLLPRSARSEDFLLSVSAPYRVERELRIAVNQTQKGEISAELFTYVGHFPCNTAWRSPTSPYSGPCELTFDLDSGDVSLSGRTLGQAPVPLNGRRFAWKLILDADMGGRYERLTGHYIAAEGRPVDAGYYQGDDYVNHEEQSQGEHPRVLKLMGDYRAKGPVLEIGCATGGLIEHLDLAGIPAWGVDISEWAVARAKERLGSGRAFVCNAEDNPIPEDVLRHKPFGTLVLWAVFEHFRDPFGTLARLTPLVSPGGIALINTSNAGGFSRMLFGEQWEGHYDWTHHGVDLVTAASLRERLPAIGWEIEELWTDTIWDGNPEPTHASVREWWEADARFRQMIRERELGDLIVCVARRR